MYVAFVLLYCGGIVVGSLTKTNKRVEGGLAMINKNRRIKIAGNVLVKAKLDDLEEEFYREKKKMTPKQYCREGWFEENGLVYFTVTSDGTSGPKWVSRLEQRNCRIKDCAKRVLFSSSFDSTSGVTTKVVIFRGLFFGNNDRSFGKIKAFAVGCRFFAPQLEIACLIRQRFTDKEIEEMGFWRIVVMRPVKDFNGDWRLLSINRSAGGNWLDTNFITPSLKLDRNLGFAFVV